MLLYEKEVHAENPAQCCAVLYCMYVDTFKIYRVVCESGRIGGFFLCMPLFSFYHSYIILDGIL